jgi:hypothetical protein
VTGAPRRSRHRGVAGSHGTSKLRRRAGERATKCGREVAVAREAKIQRQRREVICVRQLDECPGEPGLTDVPVQRQALESSKDVGQIGWRAADRAGDVTETDRIAKVCLYEFLRTTDQSPGGPPGLARRRFHAERGTEKCHDQLVGDKQVRATIAGAVEETGAEKLQARLHAAPSAPEQRMMPHAFGRGLDQVGEQRQIRGDAQLGVALGSRRR